MAFMVHLPPVGLSSFLVLRFCTQQPNRSLLRLIMPLMYQPPVQLVNMHMIGISIAT